MAAYKLRKNTDNPKLWECFDSVNKVSCVFEEKRFNDSCKYSVSKGADNPNPEKWQTIKTEMAYWLRANHYDKVY